MKCNFCNGNQNVCSCYPLNIFVGDTVILNVENPFLDLTNWAILPDKKYFVKAIFKIKNTYEFVFENCNCNCNFGGLRCGGHLYKSSDGFIQFKKLV